MINKQQALAAVFQGVPGELELRRIPIPEPRPGEILVRVLACTICGSDTHSLEGRRKVPVPTILGHEIVGRIVAFGGDREFRDLAGNSLRIGDRVVWAIVAHCGTCDLCRQGLPQKCRHATKYGHEPFRPGYELLGGLADYCLLVQGTSLVRVPDELPLEVACPASCATATVVAACEAAGNLEGRRICVLGAGMLGLTACAYAESHGAAEVVCVDPVPVRRTRAALFGATRTVAPDEFESQAKASPESSQFDIVLELSGQPRAFESVWSSVATGGTVALVGSVFPSDPVSLRLEEVVRRHVSIRGIHNYSPRHLLCAVQFLAKCHDDYPFALLLAKWFSLEEVGAAFSHSHLPESVRVGVRSCRT